MTLMIQMNPFSKDFTLSNKLTKDWSL